MRSLLSLIAPIAGALFLAKSSSAAVVPLQRRSVWAPAQGGCWTDSPQDRALQHFAGSFDTDLTPQKCQSICEQAGFSLAGVEYARECYCGNTIMGNNHPQAGICNMQCTGSTDICGGANAINIYVKDNFQYTVGPASVLQSYNGYDVTQCWSDDASNRVLKNGPSPSIPFDQMTVQKCIDGCAAAGYSSAGVEYAGECYCDNVTYPPSQSEPMTDCNMGCTGDGTEFCGGPNRIIIYHKTPVTGPINYSGKIKVVNPQDPNQIYGWLSSAVVTGVEALSPTIAGAEIFTFSVPSGTTTQVEITATHGIGGFPFLGLIANTGNALGDDHWKYTMIGGTNDAAPGATPQNGANSYKNSGRAFETSVWTINTATWEITGVWVDPNTSLHTVIPIWYEHLYMIASPEPDATRDHLGVTATTSPSGKLVFVPGP